MSPSGIDPATWTVILNVLAVVLNTLGAALGAYLRARGQLDRDRP